MLRVATGALALAAMAASCGGGGDEWAAEAEVWTTAYVEWPNEIGGAAHERFWAEEMWWDYRSVIRDSQVVSRDGALADAIRTMPPGTRTAEADGPPLISVDGAVVLMSFDWGPSGADRLPDTELVAHLVTQLRSIGPGGADWAKTAMSTTSWRERRTTWHEADRADEVAEMWARACAAPRLGSPGRALRRRRRGVGLDCRLGSPRAGRDHCNRFERAGDLVEGRPAGGRDTAVYPVTFFHAGLDGVIAVFEGHGGDGWVGRVAVALDLNRRQVVAEERFWEIARVRRCLPTEELPTGWWTGCFLTDTGPEPPPPKTCRRSRER